MPRCNLVTTITHKINKLKVGTINIYSSNTNNYYIEVSVNKELRYSDLEIEKTLINKAIAYMNKNYSQYVLYGYTTNKNHNKKQLFRTYCDTPRVMYDYSQYVLSKKG